MALEKNRDELKSDSLHVRLVNADLKALIELMTYEDGESRTLKIGVDDYTARSWEDLASVPARTGKKTINTLNVFSADRGLWLRVSRWNAAVEEWTAKPPTAETTQTFHQVSAYLRNRRDRLWWLRRNWWVLVWLLISQIAYVIAGRSYSTEETEHWVALGVIFVVTIAVIAVVPARTAPTMYLVEPPAISKELIVAVLSLVATIAFGVSAFFI